VSGSATVEDGACSTYREPAHRATAPSGGAATLPRMDGAESLVRTLAAGGVDVCFANPGTTELHLVRALDRVGAIRPVLGLFEGVCSAAADGFARMAGRPALVLLHLGPGLGNALANLHNAAKGRTPVVAVVGDHATTHRGLGAPLEADVEGFARPVSAWLRTSASAGEVAGDGAAALAAATSAPGGVATLVVPADCAWGEADGPAQPLTPRPPARVADDVIGAAAGALRPAGDGRSPSAERDALGPAGDGRSPSAERDARPAALLLGGDALGERGLRAAGRIAAATGCLLLHETFPRRMERGGDLPAPARLPYFPEPATELLARARALVLAGAPEPVAFFAYPGLPGRLAPAGLPVHPLAAPGEDAVDALERLAEEVGAGSAPAWTPLRPLAPPAPPAPGLLTPESAVAAVVAAQPEGAVVVDEWLTLSEPYVRAAAAAPRHTMLALTGGAIGWGVSTATGAALAAPDRPVLCLQADGSGMYAPQALWTQAREGLDVTTVVAANGAYRILEVELERAGMRGGAGHRPRFAAARLGRALRRPRRARRARDDVPGARRRAAPRARRARPAPRGGRAVNEEELAIRGESIRLGQLLKLVGLVDSGADAKALLAAGEVRVNGEVEVRRGRQVRRGDVVVALGRTVRGV